MDEQEQPLTKKERRALAKQQKAEERNRAKLGGSVKNWLIGLLVVALLVIVGWWVWTQVSKPLPGEAVEDLGRNHVPDGTEVAYNSNPPTSGNHYAEWTRAGVYNNPVSDGHLIHSLEHGYVVISYNCDEISNLKSQISNLNVYAHEEELTPEASPSAEEATESTQLTGAWESQGCKDLVAKLTSIYEKKGKKKLIVIPRPNLDAKIALTAWGRIDPSTGSGFDSFDEARIIKFIDAFRDKGPEKTME